MTSEHRERPRRYLKKPIPIEGLRFNGYNAEHLREWSGGDVEEVGRDSHHYEYLKAKVLVKTREGEVVAVPGDTILRGAHGEHYPIGEQILIDTYDEIEEGT